MMQRCEKCAMPGSLLKVGRPGASDVGWMGGVGELVIEIGQAPDVLCATAHNSAVNAAICARLEPRRKAFRAEGHTAC
jgi:hypothetical protein